MISTSQKTSLLKITIAPLIIAGLLSSCLRAGASKSGGGAGSSSKLTEVKMQLPASTVFKPTGGSAVVNALSLTVRPKDENCTGATKISETRSYTDAVLNQKFFKGCDYLVTLALGEKLSNGDFKSYYQNASEHVVSQDDLTVSPAQIPIKLSLTSNGRAAQMPETLSQKPTPEPPTTPAPIPPTQEPTPVPGSGLAPLPSHLASAELVGPNNATTTLDKVFSTEYLLVDYSQLGCGPCQSHSKAVNTDRTLQNLMSGTSKCRSITVVGTPTIDDWVGLFEQDLSNLKTFTGKTSYGYKRSFIDFSTLLGLNVRATPTVQLIDRTGKVVVSNARSTQSIASYCR